MIGFCLGYLLQTYVLVSHWVIYLCFLDGRVRH
jgi:hypothetical protein